MTKKAAIIIVNWNGKVLLETCLSAVKNQTYKAHDVYFVDNGSSDDSVTYVRKHFPDVHIIDLKENTGFATGNNHGIREALKDKEVAYVVSLNNDTKVYTEWLSSLVKTVESDIRIGAVSSRAYFDDEKTINNAGLMYAPALQVNKRGGISVGFGCLDNEIDLSHDQEVFAAGGVAALYTREVVEKILARDGEFFDEDFFAYGEDLDVGFRIRSLGYISYLSAGARLVHFHSKTGGAASSFKAYFGERNAILTAIKNLPIIDVLLFPIRNIALKWSYFKDGNQSVQTLKSGIGMYRMIWLFVSAHIVALLLAPKMLWKRWKIR